MPHANEPRYVSEQYATSANLDVRIALHQKYSTASRPFHDWLFDHVHLRDGARVLEVGSGSGALWSHVFARIPSGWKILLSDLSFGMVRTVHQKFLDSRFSFLQSDVQDLPFAAATFDAVFANHMLYHVPDLARGLGEIRRILKPGGSLYAATNGLAHLGELAALVANITGQPVRTDTPERLFGLENGQAILANHFEHITGDVQENNLRITDVEPLVAYAKSGVLYTSATLHPVYEQEFRRQVQSAIDAKGAFHITKAVGLFVAS